MITNFSNYRTGKSYNFLVKGVEYKGVEILEKIPHKIHLKFTDGSTNWYTNEDLTAQAQKKVDKIMGIVDPKNPTVKINFIEIKQKVDAPKGNGENKVAPVVELDISHDAVKFSESPVIKQVNVEVKPTPTLEIDANKDNIKSLENSSVVITRMGNKPTEKEYEAIKQEYADIDGFALRRYKMAIRQIEKQKGWGELPRTCTLQDTLDILLKAPSIK